MNDDSIADGSTGLSRSAAPFRRAVLGGMGVVMPPLLTIVLFIWAWNTIDDYVLAPVERVVRGVIVSNITDAYDRIPADVRPGDQRAKDGRVVEFDYEGQTYVQLLQGQWVSKPQFEELARRKGRYEAIPPNAEAFYQRYVELRYLSRWRVIPLFLTIFVLLLYVLGKFMAFGVGRVLWLSIENLVSRLPIIRNVYSSVKQVTDLLFGEHKEIAYSRVVAVEYPRAGTWAIAFVTGEGFDEMQAACGEPVLSLLVPTSPMPATGFAIVVRKSETIDLNITIDQALQFIVSCGVVTPPSSPPSRATPIQSPRGLPAPGSRVKSHEVWNGASSREASSDSTSPEHPPKGQA